MLKCENASADHTAFTEDHDTKWAPKHSNTDDGLTEGGCEGAGGNVIHEVLHQNALLTKNTNEKNENMRYN